MQEHLQHVDAVMIGREAYNNTYLMADLDRLFYGSDTVKPGRRAIVHGYADYIEEQMSQGVPLIQLTRHVLGLMHACPGAKNFRRVLSENAWKKGQDAQLLLDALAEVDCD